VAALLVEDWLHKKAEESAHNEILAFLSIILGVQFLIAGLLVTILISGQEWWLFAIYEQLQTASISLGLILTIIGFAISLTGFMLVIYYNKKRSWYRRQIEKSSVMEKWKMKPKSVDEILEEYVGKRRKRI
jgi:NADH:ubiquinone oxidoreductase subunit 5 (subunit L)/multisubunit Na+/H+ antiporter MnhA subunit